MYTKVVQTTSKFFHTIHTLDVWRYAKMGKSIEYHFIYAIISWIQWPDWWTTTAAAATAVWMGRWMNFRWENVLGFFLTVAKITLCIYIYDQASKPYSGVGKIEGANWIDLVLYTAPFLCSHWIKLFLSYVFVAVAFFSSFTVSFSLISFCSLYPVLVGLRKPSAMLNTQVQQTVLILIQ